MCVCVYVYVCMCEETYECVDNCKVYNYITLCTITRKVQHSEEQLYIILFQ